MPINRLIVLAAGLLLAAAAWAQDAPQLPPAVSDAVYKGVVGKVLDAMPMDPEERVVLQRTSAVVSGTLAGRSLTLWAGLTHPVLWIAGLAWGLFSASNIKAADTNTRTVDTNANPETKRVEIPAPIEIEPTQVAVLIAPPVEEIADAAR